MTTKIVSIAEENILPILKKRGRKPKKETEALKLEENIVIKIEESSSMLNENVNSENSENSEQPNNNDENIYETLDKPIGKKRGRKPKGGKIVQQITQLTNLTEIKPNVILHLKCCLNDLNIDKSHNDFLLEGYSFSKTNHTFLNKNT
jgi:hypothetical protein